MSIPLMNPTGLGIMASMALPVSYMAYRQVAAMPERNERMQGGLTRIGFWGGLAATAAMGLKVAAPLFKTGNNLAALSVLAVASSLPVIGSEVFKRIGRWAFPSTQGNNDEKGLAPQTIPEDLISSQIGHVNETGSGLQGAPQISPMWNGPQTPPPMPGYAQQASYYPGVAPTYNTMYSMPMPQPVYGDPSSSPFYIPPPSSFLTSYPPLPMMPRY